MKVGEFFIDLAVDATSGNLSVNQLVSSFGKLDVVSIGTVGTIGKITSALFDMAKAAQSTAVEMSILGDITGVDTEKVLKWERAAQTMHLVPGTISGAVMAVHKMMAGFQAGETKLPESLTGRFGIAPHRIGEFDKEGRTVYKDFFDIIEKMSEPGSTYRGRSRAVQQTGLEDIFGVGGLEIFRLLEGIKSGEFDPSKLSTLSNKQIEELADLKGKQTEIGNQIVGIFEKLLTAGGKFETILDSISGILVKIDKFIDSKEGAEVARITGELGETALKSLKDPVRAKSHLLNFLLENFPKPLELSAAGAPRGAGFAPQMTNWNGTLNLNILGEMGVPLWSKTIFMKEGVTNTDVNAVIENFGNSGKP